MLGHKDIRMTLAIYTHVMPGMITPWDSYNLGVLPRDQNLEPGAEDRCELCGRRVGEGSLTRHHLLPVP